MKRGSFYPMLVVVIMLTLVLTALVTMMGKLEDYEEHVGTAQFDLLTSYETGEVVLHYMDSSLRLALLEAIERPQTGCGTHLGYPIWASSEKECYPDEGFFDNMRMEPYLEVFGTTEMPDIEFDYSVQDNYVVATPDENLKMLIDRGEAGACCKITNPHYPEGYYRIYSSAEECTVTWSTSPYIDSEPVDWLFCAGENNDPIILKASEELFIPEKKGKPAEDTDLHPDAGSILDIIPPTQPAKLSSCFENRASYCPSCSPVNHHGTDIAVSIGSDVYAAADGKVIYAGSGPTDYYTGNFVQYGTRVIIHHQSDELEYWTLYAHLNSEIVDAGETVKQGDLIGYSGCSGNCGGAHLHFEIRAINNQWDHTINPFCLDPNYLLEDGFWAFNANYCKGLYEGFPCDWQNGAVWRQVMEVQR